MSRKLNIRVTEKVMFGVPYYTEQDEQGKAVYDSWENYSTDMNAAMEVLEALQGEFEVWSEGKGVFGVRLTSWTGPETIARILHKSLPVAICLATLRASGDDDWVDEYLKENK